MKFILVAVHDPRFTHKNPTTPVVSVTVLEDPPSSDEINRLMKSANLTRVSVTAVPDDQGEFLKRSLGATGNADPNDLTSAYISNPSTMALCKLYAAIFNLGKDSNSGWFSTPEEV